MDILGKIMSVLKVPVLREDSRFSGEVNKGGSINTKRQKLNADKD